MKRVWIIAGAVSAVLLLIVLVMHIAQRMHEAQLVSSRVIELRDDGFVPKKITIQTGETVTFVTKTGKAFWPASNLHPSHLLYPDFDSKEPIEATGSWQFAFEKSGRFRYHDHISSEFTGVISVLDPGQNEADLMDCSSLQDKDIQAKEQCWEERLSGALEKGGLKEAYAVFASLYATDAEFVTSGCHKHAHRIGDTFFREYTAKRWTLEGLDLPQETVACGYGFFHGLFEHFFRKFPNVALVERVCADLEKRYIKTMPLIRVNCYHGAGHGLIADPPDRSQWGKPLLMIAGALGSCRSISPKPGEIEQCKEGIFNVISDWTIRSQYGLSYRHDDPFWLCKELDPSDRLACYYEMVMIVPGASQLDLPTISSRYIENIPEKEIAHIVISSLAAGFMERGVALGDHFPFLLECRTIASHLLQGCIEGIIGGFRAHGQPGKEHEKAFIFCSDNRLTSGEKDICFTHLIKNLWYMYEEGKARRICMSLPYADKSLCAVNPVTQW